MSKKEGDIDEWLLIPSSDVSDDGGPEGDFDADELAFDRVFRQELETRLASEEQLHDIPNIEILEMELSGENYNDNLEVENEEGWDSADDGNTNYEAELQGVDHYRAQGEEPSDSVEAPLGEVIESCETVSPPPTQFFQHGDSEPYHEPPSKRLNCRGRPRGGERGKQRVMDRGRPRTTKSSPRRGGSRGVQRGRVQTRGGIRGESPKVPKFLVAVSTKDIEFMAPNVE